MKYTELIKLAKKHGFWLYRQANGSHEIWVNDKGVKIVIPRHGSKEFTPNTERSIIKAIKGEK